MHPVPRAGRNKIALMQERLQRRSKTLQYDVDFPENIADCVGSLDYWLKSLKAFRWHDQQMSEDPGHAITRRGFAVLLGIDTGQVTRVLRRHGVTGLKSKDVYLWREMRVCIGRELIKKSMAEILELSFSMPTTGSHSYV